MKIKIVGVQNVDFTSDDGKVIKGKKLHCLDLEPNNVDVQGNTCKTVFIGANAPYQPVYELGKSYIAYSEVGGKGIAFMQEIK